MAGEVRVERFLHWYGAAQTLSIACFVFDKFLQGDEVKGMYIEDCGQSGEGIAQRSLARLCLVPQAFNLVLQVQVIDWHTTPW